MINACLMYSEQEGVKRHAGGNIGDKKRWYPRTNLTKTHANGPLGFPEA